MHMLEQAVQLLALMKVVHFISSLDTVNPAENYKCDSLTSPDLLARLE
jgi:hypothetical protein